MSEWNAKAPRLQFPTVGIPSETGARILAAAAFAVVTLLLLDFGNDMLKRNFYSLQPYRIYLPFAAAFAGAAVFFNTRYSDFNALLKACLRASAVGLIVMLIVEMPDYSLGNPEARAAYDYVGFIYPVALACAVAGVFRPAFVIPTVIYIASTRYLVQGISGLEMSFLDIRYMLDMALYLAVFGIFVVKIAPRIPRVGTWLGAESRQLEVVGVGFGLHLANYFWSAIAKMTVGPTPWYWIFDNNTQNQIPYTMESGILPIGHMPWLAQFAYDTFGFFHVPLNAAILFAQLFAIVCVLRVGWLKITSILFDLLHIGIYLLGGLFFWPWIWNNLTIWWAARSSRQGLSINTKVTAIATILLGAPMLNINPAAWLGWFDVADARQIYFEAVTEDGRTVKVPSAFFVSHSYSVSHGYMGHQQIDGQYEGTQGGATHSFERNEHDGACVDPTRLKSEAEPETPEHRQERMETLEHFLKFHHAKMLDREAMFGRGTWYLHVHHHPSNPFLYGEFNDLSLRTVVGYNLVMESDCLSVKDGQVQKKVLRRDTEYYDVR